MKAWGLVLSIVALCVACSTPRPSVPAGWPDDAFGGPSMPSPIDLDRADAGVNVMRDFARYYIENVPRTPEARPAWCAA